MVYKRTTNDGHCFPKHNCITHLYQILGNSFIPFSTVETVTGSKQTSTFAHVKLNSNKIYWLTALQVLKKFMRGLEKQRQVQ